MATFAVYRHGMKALIEGRDIEAAEAAVDQKLASIRGGVSGTSPEEGTATSLHTIQNGIRVSQTTNVNTRPPTAV